MFLKLQTKRSIGANLLHYGAWAGLGAASFTMGPFWAVGAGLAVMGGLFTYSYKLNKEFLDDGLLAHPDKHEFSPNLKKIVSNLSEKCGLGRKNVAAYDFKVNPRSIGARSSIGRQFEKLLGKVAITPNAAAINLGKPVVMISEPLLELLDDHEEEAVLAHEFAHIMAEHHKLRFPQIILNGAVKFTNVMTMLGQFIATGWIGVPTVIASSVGAHFLLKKLHPKAELHDANIKEDPAAHIRQRVTRSKDIIGSTKNSRRLFKSSIHDDNFEKRDEKLRRQIESDEKLIEEKQRTLKDIQEIKDVKSHFKYASQFVAVGTASLFNPAYAGFFASVFAINKGAQLLTKSYSRANEFQADAGAVTIGSSPLAMITALRKISIIQKRSIDKAWGGEKPEPGMLKKVWAKATATHPPLDERIERLAKIAKEQGIHSSLDIHMAINGPLDIPNHLDIPVDHIVGMATAFVGPDAFNNSKLVDKSGYANANSSQASPTLMAA